MRTSFSPLMEDPVSGGGGGGVSAPASSPTAPTPSSPASSGVSEPWAKSWIQPDFTLNHKALDGLPDHLKGLRPTLERQKNFEGVLMALDHANTVAGKKALAPLAADAPPEVIAERKSLLDTINGVPQKPQEYGITKPEGFPDAQWNQALADQFTAWAHKHSISPAAAKELVYDIQGKAVQEALSNQAQYESQFWAKEQQLFEVTIKRENIPVDKANSLVEKGAAALGLDLSNEQTKMFLKGANARIMAMRHAIAIGDDVSVAAPASNSVDRDPTALANSAMRNPSDPLYAVYWNREGKYSRADHQAAVEKVNGWLQQAEAKSPRRGALRK